MEHFEIYILKLGAKDDWDFRTSDLMKNPDGMIFNPSGELR